MAETMIDLAAQAIMRKVPHGYGMTADEAKSYARAVIEEMKEPTLEMRHAVSANWGRRTWSDYREVIDAALANPTPAPTEAHPTQPQAEVEPDYCYDPSAGEFTCNWEDRDQVHGHGEGLNRGEPMRVSTLTQGPDKWVADVPITWDENGDPDETETKWFDSEDAARAALSSTAKEG